VDKRTSFIARLVAVLALAGAVIVLIVAVSTSLTGGDSDSSSKARQDRGQQGNKRPKTKAATYVVKSGDTLTAIAHRTGVPVAVILALNPEVDPQILIAGQTLKLR
jgi:LysM repeat protein